MLRRLQAGMWEHSRSPRILGMNARDRDLVTELNARRDRELVDDKLRTKEIMERVGVRTPKTLRKVGSFVDADQASRWLLDCEEFVIKPARGRAGGGILVIQERTETGWRDTSGRVWQPRGLCRYLGNILYGEFSGGISDRAIVEERLLAGNIFAGEIPDGLPDVRILVVSREPVLAMLRLPTKRSKGKANLHLGGVGVGIDMDSGVTFHATTEGRSIDKHPDTGTELLGERIPHWKEVLKLATKAAAALPLGYLGLDVALPRGQRPLLLEANARPGLEIQNVNRAGLRERLSALSSREQPRRAAKSVGRRSGKRKAPRSRVAKRGRARGK